MSAGHVHEVADGDDRLRERVLAALRAFLDGRAAAVAELGDELAVPMSVLAELTGGGKLLRPAFCYWGFRAAGGIDAGRIGTDADAAARPGPGADGIIAAAAALELLHVSALIHDDVMDRSDRRRGRPAAHRQFAVLHREAGWAGEAEDFGTAGAILLGDLCLAWSDDLLRGCGLPAERLAAGQRVYAAMRTEVIGGQYLDLVAQAAMAEASVARAMRVIRYKTAKYSVERPLHLGVALAGGTGALTAAFTAFGIPLGEAFQLRDDILGVFGDPDETGKPAGDDIRCGKHTVLVATALTVAQERDRATLLGLLGDPGLDERGVGLARQILVDTGALAEVEALIGKLAAEAAGSLAAAPIAEPAAREVLAGLAVAATRRSA